MLDAQLLERLQDAWHEQGAPFEEALAPGRLVERLESEDGSLRVELPTELRTWWAWRDGGVAGIDVRKTHMGPLLQPLSSVRACKMWQESIREARRVAERMPAGPLVDPDVWWQEAWVPLFSDGSGYLIADCALDPPNLAPIRRIEWGLEPDSYVPRTRSLGQFVEWWLEAIESGLWYFDRDDGQWATSRTPSNVAAEAKYNGLI